MEHTSEAVDPLAAVRRRVQELRRRKNWSAAELGERLTAVGVPWNRSIVANFENGRRPAVSVQELLALASVLDVAPINLLTPLADVPYEVTAGRTVPAAEARAWIAGTAPLPGVDRHIFFSEAPAVENHPAARAAVELAAEVTELAALAGVVRVPDRFPALLALARSSLARVSAEIDRLEVEQGRAVEVLRSVEAESRGDE
jgi:transcriptional regulator with XRE-family HTH domain